jgi:hypothetical protein
MTNDPIEPQRRRDDDETRELGDLHVSTGSQSAYITIEMILYVLVVLGIFVTSAIIDEDGPGPGFSASQAWFYVTLLTIGLFLNRGLARFHASRASDRTF